VPSLNELAAKPYNGNGTYADVVHFVHIYIIEPHPQGPDLSPYSGRVWEAQYSTVGQPETLYERIAVAQQTEILLEGNQLLLIDDLTPGRLNNPVWCTYGTAPNSAFLIRQDGIIDTAQSWLDTAEMEKAINNLLK